MRGLYNIKANITIDLESSSQMRNSLLEGVITGKPGTLFQPRDPLMGKHVCQKF